MASLWGCDSDVRRATRLVLVSDTDIRELDRVRFDITPPAGDPRDAEARVSPGAPAWLVMERGENASSGPYEILVTGRDDDGLRAAVTRTATVSFEEGKTLVVPLHLEAACGSACPPVTQGELVPWTGSPPTLSSTSVDAGSDEPGHDAAASDDAGGTNGSDAGGMNGSDAGPDGSAACIPNSCRNGELVVCTDGVMTGTMPCPSAAGVCEESVCRDGEGCVVEPANGKSCGTGLTCADGVCACSTAHCICTARDGSCERTCRPGSQCDLTCPNNTECVFHCGGAESCVARCGNNASCVLYCEGVADCGFHQATPGCRTGERRTCSDGVFACNADCP